MHIIRYFNQVNINIIRLVYTIFFLIPLNIFIIGDWIGTGIQWIFFRYQITYLGSSVIPVTQSLSYAVTGIVSGKSALSEMLLFFGAICFTISYIHVLSNRPELVRRAGILTIIAGILVLSSIFLQYSIRLHSSAGTSVPVGLPLVFIFGLLLCYYESGFMKNIPDLKKSVRTDDDRKTDEFAFSIHKVLSSVNSPIIKRVLENKEILFLFVLSCVFFFRIFLNYDKMFAPPGSNNENDIILLYSFWRSFFATNIIHGFGVPLWNPYVFSGTPFLGNPSAEIFYPLTWLFVFFNSDTLFGFIFFLDVFLIGTFTYWYARSINLGTYGSLISAIAFMFSGAVISRMYAGHLSIVDGIVWFPLILLFYERSFKDKPLFNGCCAGICLALMGLTGGMQIFLIGIVTFVLYLVFRTVFHEYDRPLKQRICHLSMLLSASLLVGGIGVLFQFLPTWEFSQFSNRAGGVSYFFSTQYSFPPSGFITAILPDFFRVTGPVTSLLKINFWEYSCYIGVLPLVLAFLGFSLNKTRYRYLFLFLAAFSLFFSFGKYSIIYPFFYYYVPFFSSFRVPPRSLFIGLFSLAILAGMGADIIAEGWRNCNQKHAAIFRFLLKLAGIVILGMCIITCLGWEYFGIPSMIISGIVFFTIIFCFGTWIISYHDQLSIDTNLVKQLVIAIIVIDLFLFGMPFIDVKSPEQVFNDPGFIQVLTNETDDYFRVYDATGVLNQNLAYRNNLYLVNGYDAIYLKSYQRFFLSSFSGEIDSNASFDWWVEGNTISNPDILRLLNVRYIITKKPVNLSGTFSVYNNSVHVYRLNSTYPRAYIITKEEFGNSTPLISKVAKIVEYSPNKIVIEAETSDDSYLVTSEIYYPGWVARDNKQTVKIEKNQEIFRAVRLSPGNHTIVFTYFPQIFTL